jgi:hypothetical protein
MTTLHDFGGLAFGLFLLGSHNLLVTARGSCVKWPFLPSSEVVSERASSPFRSVGSEGEVWEGGIGAWAVEQRIKWQEGDQHLRSSNQSGGPPSGCSLQIGACRLVPPKGGGVIHLRVASHLPPCGSSMMKHELLHASI